MTSKPSKNGSEDEILELPTVGSTVRYVGKLTQYAGLYKVVEIIGGERPLVISDGTRVMHARVTSVSVESEPAKKATRNRPTIQVGKAPTPQVGMLVWYRGPLREHNGVAQIAAIEGDRLTLQAGVDTDGAYFFGPCDSIGRVTVAVCHDSTVAVCGFCQSQLDSLKSGQKCGRCHQRVVAVTNPYSGIDTVPADCQLPRTPWAVAQRTTSK